MRMVKHDTATCPSCGGALWFGAKPGGSGWKVYYECDACHFERQTGRIPIEDVENRDEVWDRAEAAGEQF